MRVLWEAYTVAVSLIWQYAKQMQCGDISFVRRNAGDWLHGLLQPKLTLTSSYSSPLTPSLIAVLAIVCSWRWPLNSSLLTKPHKTSQRKM